MRLIISHDGDDLDNELSGAGLTSARFWENETVMGNEWSDGAVLELPTRVKMKRLLTSTSRTKTGYSIKCWRQ